MTIDSSWFSGLALESVDDIEARTSAESGEQDGVARDSAAGQEKVGAVGGPGEIEDAARSEVGELTGLAFQRLSLFAMNAQAWGKGQKLKGGGLGESLFVSAPRYF